MMRIVDGQAQFGAGLETVWRHHPLFVQLAERGGFVVPPLTERADAPPIHARINHGNLIADCPDCGGAEFVWQEGPYLFLCASCLNGAVGGKWRRVALTQDYAAIVAALAVRPLPQNRNWEPGETATDLRRENAERGL
jgi:hypothetical protein